MQFILEYSHLLAQSVFTKVICLEADSLEAAHRALDERIMFAIEHNRPRFEFCGEMLFLHDFVKRVSRTKWEYNAQRCKMYNTPMPRSVVDSAGNIYAFENYSLLPVADWFSAKAQKLTGDSKT